MKQTDGSESRRFQAGERVAQISFISMIFLTIFKGYAGFAYVSVALLADAVNSLSDIFASALVWSGLRLAGKEPNEKFPYGYHRGETIASLTVSILIIISGFEILTESVRRFISPVQIVEGIIPLLAAVVSAVTYFVLAKFKSKVGEEIGSRSLVADGKHSAVDVYAGVFVFVGILLSLYGLGEAEVLVALLIAIYILKQGLEIAKDSLFSLMDASPAPEKIESIRKIAEGIPGVLDIHSIRLRRAGPVYFVEAHMTVIKGISVEQAHELSSLIEEKIKEAIPRLESATIHIEPETDHRITVAVPVEVNLGMSSKAVNHFGNASFFAIADLEKGTTNNLRFIENPGHDVTEKKGVLAVDALSEESVDALIIGEIGQAPFDMMRGRFMTMYKLPRTGMTLEEVLSSVMNQEIEIIHSYSAVSQED